MRTLGTLISTLTIVAACGRFASAPAVSPGQSVQLQVEQTAIVAGSTVRVQFIRAADSRCPLDAVCITAGAAVIDLVLSGSGPTQAVTLQLGPKPMTATYGGLLLEATALDPFPSLQQPRGAQTLTLRITAL